MKASNPEILEVLNFCETLKEMYTCGEVTLPGGESKAIASASTLNNLLSIRSLIRSNKPRNTLEIGLAYGASALVALASMAEFVGDEYCHTAIDPFQSSVWKSVAVSQIDNAGFASEFRCVEEQSCLALPAFSKNGERFDLIYVDGSHIFEDVFIDFFYSTNLLNLGGHLLFDDCTDPHVKKVLHFIDNNYQTILKRVEIELDTQIPLKKRVGRALGYRQLVAYEKISDPPRPWDVKFSNF